MNNSPYSDCLEELWQPKAASARGRIPIHHSSCNTIMFANDLPGLRTAISPLPEEVGIYDVAIHGNIQGFWIRQNGSWVTVSVKDVANAVRGRLAPGEQIRSLACETGASKSGPAQQLANELRRTVWAPTKPVYPTYGRATNIRPDGSAHIDNFDISKAVVPIHNGKFHAFEPLANPQRFNAHVIKRADSNVPTR